MREGYFEEKPGVKSMSRLVSFMAELGIGGITASVCFAMIHAFIHPKEELASNLAGIIAASAGLVTALEAGAWGALRDRKRMDETAGEAEQQELPLNPPKPKKIKANHR